MTASPANTVPSALSTIGTLAAVTLKRLGRGKAWWIGIGLVALPVAFAIARRVRDAPVAPDELFVAAMVLLALLPALFIASSIGEDIEDRTSTYLWSRAIARWAVLAGKLCALTPVVIVLMAGSWYATIRTGTGAAPSLSSVLAMVAGCIAASLIAAGIATVVPRQAMVLSIGYLLVDNFIGAMPFSLAELSITHQAKLLAMLDGPQPIATPLIAMAAVSGLWAVIGLVRIRRLEV
jgi:hypothetical protein